MNPKFTSGRDGLWETLNRGEDEEESGGKLVRDTKLSSSLSSDAVKQLHAIRTVNTLTPNSEHIICVIRGTKLYRELSHFSKYGSD